MKPRMPGRLRGAAVAAISILILCAMATELAIAQPTTRPGPMMPARPGGGRGWGPISIEEQTRALEFIAENMPNLFQEIEEAETGSLRHRRMVRFAVDRYRWAQRIEREEPEQYEDMLARLRSQDEIFPLLKAYQAAPEHQQSELREQIREKVREMVLDLMEERQRRIDNLKRMLGREEHELQRDRRNVEVLTTERLNRLFEELREQRDMTPEHPAPGHDMPSTAPALRPRLRE